MKHKLVVFFVLLAVILATAGLAPIAAEPSAGKALVKIVLPGSDGLAAVEASGVPVYARLSDERQAYLLAGATLTEIDGLQAAALDVTVLDSNLRGASYYLVYLMPGQSRPDWDAYGRLLLDDGQQALLRAVPRDAQRLVAAGVELRAVTLTPKPLYPTSIEGALPTDVTPDPLIQAMIDQVTEPIVYDYTGGLSGEWSVEIGGAPYTIVTRNTYSGEPIQKATQFAGEHLAALGLDVEYHQWGGATYPNVIGELSGSINPDDIFIIGGHLDDLPSSGAAPGADDNASGSIATLLAADIMTQYEWGCTLRFALWTGEEQGLLGSHAYAQRAYNQGENIVGYLNLDMIAWNSGGSSPDIDLHADSDLPETLVLAQLFADVVDAYDLNLIPEIKPNGSGASDHASFWDYGYTSILGIEDFGDFNPYYHTVNDDMDNFEDWPYYVDFVKASIATFAHMSGCLIPSGIGYLDGTVTAASGGAPIPGATVTIDDDAGHSFETTTNGSGYYTQTLTNGTYTVTAEAYGYLPAIAPGVVVITGIVTTQDFVLEQHCEPVTDADFAWTPPQPIVGQQVDLTGTASGTLPISFTWDFGDETQGVGQAVTHTYAMADAYTVVMTVTNCEESWMTATHTIVVSPAQVCTDVQSITIQGDTTGEPGVYTFTTSYEPMDATLPISYTWDNGDVADVSVRSLGVGTHTLVVTATNCVEALVTGTHTIVVSPQEPGFYIYLPLIIRE